MSKLTNCWLKPRDDEPMFEIRFNGDIICNLDRYAVIPVEEYESLLEVQRISLESLSE